MNAILRGATLAALCASGVSAVTPGQAATLSFENLTPGVTLSSQYAALGVTFARNVFSGAGSSSSGFDWATNTDLTVVSSTGPDVGTLGSPSLVNGNLLRSFDGWFGENGDPSFSASFLSPINFFSADFAGVDAPADVTLYAYDGSAQIGTVSGATAGQFTLSFSAPRITRVAIRPGSLDDWVGVDNIRFNPVPEPTGLALVVLALGGLLLASQRAATAPG